jgi:cytochrome b
MHANSTNINIMIRIFHWFLVALFITLFMTGNNNNGGGTIHIISGYLLTSFVLARIVWGFMGDENALWHNYLYSLKTTFNYLLKLSSLTPAKFKTHNPAGSTMILIMIIMLVAIIISGLLIQSLFELEGIFLLLATYVNDSQALIIKDIHLFLSYILLIAIGFHVSGVIYSSYIYKANFPMMMITGKITFFNNEKEVNNEPI